jgi:hypothetical protein
VPMGPMPVSPRKGIAGLLFKQYPGQQQVDLKVKVDIPGSWFSAGQSGGLTAAERKEKYESIAMEYEEKHVFEPAAGRNPPLSRRASALSARPTLPMMRIILASGSS